MDNFNAAEAAARLMALEQMQGAPGQPGMPGTPGGPVQESPVMERERLAQYIASGVLGAGAAGGALALSGGHPGSLMFATPAFFGVDNSQAPNIRDVWADQLRMKMQGR